MPTPTERFFAAAWRDFVDGGGWEGPDLGDAIEKAGLGEWRAATAEEADASQCEIEEGDTALFLTAAGRAALDAVREGEGNANG